MVRTPLKPSSFISDFLENSGETPTEGMNVNGSVTPVDFDYVAAAGVEIHSMTFLVVDATIEVSEFVGGAALSTGLSLGVFSAGDVELLDLLAGTAITKLADFNQLGTVARTNDQGGGEDLFRCHVLLKDLFGAPLLLGTGQYLRMTVSDDLSGLTDFNGVVRGLSLS